MESSEHKQPRQETKRHIDDLLPGDLLADDEEVVFAIKPSLWSIAFLSVRTVIIAAAVAVASYFLAPLLQVDSWRVPILQGCGAAVLIRVGFAFLQWLSRSYVLTDKRVIRIRGVFTIDIFQCALVRIQNTFLVLTLPQRILRLGNIAFTTAGTGSVEAIWRHVKAPLQVHNQLIRAINAASNKPLPVSKEPDNGV